MPLGSRGAASVSRCSSVGAGSRVTGLCRNGGHKGLGSPCLSFMLPSCNFVWFNLVQRLGPNYGTFKQRRRCFCIACPVLYQGVSNWLQVNFFVVQGHNGQNWAHRNGRCLNRFRAHLKQCSGSICAYVRDESC